MKTIKHIKPEFVMNATNKTKEELLIEIQELKAENYSLRLRMLSSESSEDQLSNDSFKVFDYNELLADEKSLKALLDTIPDGIVVSSMDGVIRYASKHSLAITGHDSIDEIIGKKVVDFVRQDYQNKAFDSISEMLKGNYTGAAEYVVVKKDGTETLIESNANVIRDSSGNSVGILFINRNVMLRKQTEQSLNQLNELFISGPTVVFKWKNLPYWPVVYVSPNVYTQFGYKPEDFADGTISYLDFIHPDDRVFVDKEFANHLSLGLQNFELEYRIINSSGETRWVSDHTVIQKDEVTGVEHYLSTIIDITEKHISEMALKKIQEVHSKMIASISDVIFIIDSTNIITYKSPNIKTTFGWNSNELVGISAFENVHPSDREYVGDIFDEISKTPNKSKKFEIRYRCKDESFKWIEATCINLCHDEDINGILINFHDISDRKNAENEVIDKEYELSTIFEISKNGYSVSKDGIHVFVNSAYLELFGYKSSEDIVGKPIFNEIPSQQHQQFVQSKKKSQLGKEFNRYYEVQGRKADGTILDIEMRISSFKSKGEHLTLVSINDITERKAAERALKIAYGRNKALIEAIPDMMFVIDSSQKFVYYHANSKSKLLASPSDFIGKSVRDIMPEHVKSIFSEKIDYVISSGFTEDITYSLDMPESSRYFEARLVKYSENEVLAIVRDVTDAKIVAKRLSDSEEKYRLIAENTSDGFLIFENNVLVYFSQVYENITGYSYNENRNLKMTEFIKRLHPDDIGVIYEKVFKAINEKKSNLRYQYRIRHKKGHYVWIEDSTSFIYNEKVDNTRAYIVSRDITERINSENELRKLSQAIEQSPVSVVITDLDGNIEYVNAKTNETTGYSHTELLGKNPRIWKSGDQSQEFYEKYWETITSGKTWSGEFRNKKKSGELFWEHATIAPLLNAKGEITNFIAVKEDISKRKLMEEDLKLSRTKLQSILDNLQDAYIQADTEGHLVFVNPAAVKTYGYSSASEMLGYPSKTLYANEDDSRKIYGILSKTGLAKDLVILGRRKDNSKFWVSLNAQFLKNDIGQIIGTEGVFRDISARIELEDELIASKERAEQSEHKVRSMFHNSLVGFLYISIDGYVIEANPEALNLLGSPSIESTKRLNVFLYPPLIESGFAENARKCVSNKTVIDDEALYTSHWGKTSYVKYYLIPMIKDGLVIGLWANVHNLTDLWQVQQDLTVAKEKAEESDRLKSAFLQNISHEIRTPINGIIGFSKLLSEFDLNDEEKHEYAEVLAMSCNRLMNTVNDIIDISEIDTSVVNICKSIFMPLDIIHDLSDIYQHRLLSSNVELVVNIEPSSEYLSIENDPKNIYQIINSFLSNAEKFTLNGRIELGFGIKNGIITFFVKDTGIGVDESEKEKIFERFYQVDLSVSRGYEGSGLGLSIAKGLSNLLGGTISVESEVGVGSTFYFSLPIR